MEKARSPFYPGQPVPHEFFTGRQEQIERIERAIKQVASGKSQAVFLTGEYGIGKTSLAQAMKYIAEKNYNLFGIHVLLGGAKTIDDLSTRTLQVALSEEAFIPTNTEKVRNFLSKYIGKQEIFGITVDLEKIRSDAPSLSHGYLPFLRELLKRLSDSGTKGIMLVLDELNGITKNPDFAHFIKTLVDENAISANPVPLLLMLCGVEEKRAEMISHHQPVDRIFEVVRVEAMNEPEMRLFFEKTFSSAGCSIEEAALEHLCKFSTGFPKAMQIIGDCTFWEDKDNLIRFNDAVAGVIQAAKEIGQRFIDLEVLQTIESKDYHNILKKLVRAKFDITFFKTDIEAELTEPEKKKLNNFLQKLKKLNVIKSGEGRGEYIFLSRLTRLYMIMSTAV